MPRLIALTADPKISWAESRSWVCVCVWYWNQIRILSEFTFRRAGVEKVWLRLYESIQCFPTLWLCTTSLDSCGPLISLFYFVFTQNENKHKSSSAATTTTVTNRKIDRSVYNWTWESFINIRSNSTHFFFLSYIQILLLLHLHLLQYNR